VLHGGSGVPAEMMHTAIKLKTGGVSKINIATDLELAALATLHRQKSILDAEWKKLPAEELQEARTAVAEITEDKIAHLCSVKSRCRLPGPAFEQERMSR